MQFRRVRSLVVPVNAEICLSQSWLENFTLPVDVNTFAACSLDDEKAHERRIRKTQNEPAFPERTH